MSWSARSTSASSPARSSLPKQNNANLLTDWRDFDGDFGRDLLREHYRNARHAH